MYDIYLLRHRWWCEVRYVCETGIWSTTVALLRLLTIIAHVCLLPDLDQLHVAKRTSRSRYARTPMYEWQADTRFYICLSIISNNNTSETTSSGGAPLCAVLWQIWCMAGCSAGVKYSFEPRYDKTNKVTVRPVWSEPSLSAWRKLGSLATNWAHSEDSDQTGRMPRLIWVFAGRTLILLVLSWGGSFTISERLLIPTIQFSAKDVRDVSPTQNQVIIFPTVLQNIGNCYNPGTGVFTAPTNGTYIFSMQTCTYSAQYAYFQLVVDSSDNVILVLRNYDSAAYTTTSDSVPHYLMVGQRVWVQSYLNSGTTITLVHVEENCWNHFSGVLVNF